MGSAKEAMAATPCDPADRSERPESSRAMLLTAAALLVLTLAAYVPVIATGGFIWDDDDYLTNNPYVQAPDGIDEIWELEPFQGSNTRQYYPMVFTTFWIEHALWGLNPAGYHFVNVMLHALNAILLWRLLVMIRVPGAWIAAAIFALHPVHVESVAWITERKNVLSLLFYLTAAWAYLRFDSLREKTDPDDRKNIWGWYGAALVLFVAALLSKSVTCSLPAALILVHLWRRQRLTAARLGWLAPFFAIGLMLALNTAMLERVQVGAEGDAFDQSFVERALIASKALLFYPWKLMVPVPLMFVYPRWGIEASDVLSYWSIGVCVLVAAGCLVLYARGCRGAPLAIAFFAGTIFPALGFFNVYPHQFSFVADHFVYHASIGLIVLFAAGVATVLTRPGVRLAVMATPLMLLAMLTWKQGLIYQDADTLWRATIERNPDAWLAHNNLAGNALREAELRLNARQTDEAADLLAEAQHHALEAIRIKPDHHTARANLARAYRLQGRPAEGIPHLLEAVRARPDFPAHRWNLGNLYQLTGETDKAITAYNEAIDAIEAAAEKRSNSPWAHVDYTAYNLQLAQLLIGQKRIIEGEAILQQVVRFQPRHFSGLFLLGQIAERRGDSASAAQRFRQILDRQAIQTPRQDVSFCGQYARFLTTATDEAYRNVEEAKRWSDRLMQITGGRDPAALLVQASVQEAAGDRATALESARSALRLAEPMNLEEIVHEAKRMIESLDGGATPPGQPGAAASGID